LNVRGSSAASGSSLGAAAISATAPAALTTKARDIVHALVSKRPIGCAAIAGLQPSHRHGKALLPTQPSHALVSMLKTLLKFGRKMVILGRLTPSIAADRSVRLSASYRTAFFIELPGPTLAFPTSAI
jgi:hypothetical protein